MTTAVRFRAKNNGLGIKRSLKKIKTTYSSFSEFLNYQIIQHFHYCLFVTNRNSLIFLSPKTSACEKIEGPTSYLNNIKKQVNKTLTGPYNYPLSFPEFFSYSGIKKKIPCKIYPISWFVKKYYLVILLWLNNFSR